MTDFPLWLEPGQAVIIPQGSLAFMQAMVRHRVSGHEKQVVTFLVFRNTSENMITGLKYSVRYTDSLGNELCRIDLEDQIIIEPGAIGNTVLTHDENEAGDDQLYNKLHAAAKARRVKFVLGFTEVTFQDGATAGALELDPDFKPHVAGDRPVKPENKSGTLAPNRTCTAPPSDGEDIPRVGQVGVEPPVFTSRTTPKFPDKAAEVRGHGCVILQAVFRKNGEMDHLEVITGLGKGELGFEQAAMDAVKQWKFMPGRLHGQPADVRMKMRVDFSSS